MEPLRVLHTVGIMDRGGMESRTMDIYRNIDKNLIQFDFLVRKNKKGHFNDEIFALGGRIISISQKNMKQYHQPHILSIVRQQFL